MAVDVGEDDLDTLLDSALDDFGTAHRPSTFPNKNNDLANASSDAPSSSSGPSARDTSIPQKSAPTGLGFDPLARPKKKGSQKKPTKSSAETPEMDEMDMAKLLAELTKLGVVPDQGDGDDTRGATSGSSPHDLRATLAALAEQTRNMSSSGAHDSGGAGEGEDDPLYSELMKQFGSLGDNPDLQSVMDSMMQHLLSKDVLYQPLKEIEGKYPAWLNANAPTLQQDELRRYTTQFALIQKLLHLYDTQPEDYSHITELLQQMQECGQPPAELMKGLTQGVEMGPDGLPKFPGLPNMEDAEQQCTIA
eukprot:CAMPEP_0198197934 /NCGR_PEP_ID=MMETSP1445-20131203/1497_1 /TAXON_ID=36898 /ORGANISM="Pyramimonas sp., Strain CCMP2087" /LENGTH=305 /DNA_ID=CAMNT_0043867359 /DNA_START=95 /DNA_END=1012 /DNA_ORIENTATION=-